MAFSGGKDSVVIKKLADMAGVKYDAHYSLTTVDPPELVNFIKKEYPEVKFEKPLKTMWELIKEKAMPPTRLVRYCCEKLKENRGTGRIVVTGIRKQESAKRAKRKMFEVCFRDKSKHYLNIIFDWSEQDVWEFIKKYNVKYCNLYDKGYKRLGCIGCPMSSNQLKELNAYPKYKLNYLKAFKRMLIKRKEKGLETKWSTAEEVMSWWVNNNKQNKDQQQFIFMDN